MQVVAFSINMHMQDKEVNIKKTEKMTAIEQSSTTTTTTTTTDTTARTTAKQTTKTEKEREGAGKGKSFDEKMKESKKLVYLASALMGLIRPFAGTQLMLTRT